MIAVTAALSDVLSPQMIAVTAALSVELKPFHERVGARPSGTENGVSWGQLLGREIALVMTGMGHRGVEATVGPFLLEHRPDVLISTGFAGALQQGLEPGDLVLMERVVLDRTASTKTEETASDPRLLDIADRVLAENGWAHRRGTGVTCGGVVQAGEKRALGERWGAVTVDMESYWIGRQAEHCGVPFLAMRTILDSVDTWVPPVADERGRIRADTLVELLIRPWRWPGLVHLAMNAFRVAQTLSSVLETLVSSFALLSSREREQIVRGKA